MARQPKQKTVGRIKSSIVLRLNTRLFFRLLWIYLGMDLLLALLFCFGMILWAEGQCAEIAYLVRVRGVPSLEATQWMQAGDYTVTAIDPATGAGVTFGWEGQIEAYTATAWEGGSDNYATTVLQAQPTGLRLPGWFPTPEETSDGIRYLNTGDLDLFRLAISTGGSMTYTLYMPNAGQPYAITLDLSGPTSLALFGLRILVICQLVSLVSNLLKNMGTIKKTLRPIQELAAAAAKLGHAERMSPEELRALAGKLDQINATHLDTRISVPGTQRELKALAEAINAMLDRINEAYRSQMRFVSDASHELRTPIAVIQGYASLLNRWGKDDPATRQEAIDAIQGEAGAMKELVEQLLFLARGDNDSMHIEMELFDLTEVASEVLKETEMIDQTHTFSAAWEDAIPIFADIGLIKQALRILVDNSIKYTPAGGQISLSAAVSQGQARLSVQDQGQGIDAAALPHIFDRFYRTDESRARQTGGTGLGLSIAKWIVDRHRGWFEVRSWEGVGTRMTIVLPLNEAAGEEPPADLSHPAPPCKSA